MNYKPTQLLFIDATVNDIETLLQGALPGIEGHILSGEQDGVAQITQILQHRPEVNTVHIVSHGAPGCLYLGNSQLNLDTLKNYASQLQGCSRENLNLLLYGCNVAAGDAGEEFLYKLRSLTDAKIAASATKTGNAALEGDWDLEVTMGEITPKLAFSHQEIANYAGILASTVPFDVSSAFDADAIVNRTGGVTDTTQTAIDAGNKALITQSFATSADSTLGNGLPDNGLFSATNFHPDIQLSYRNSDNGNNAHLIKTSTGSFTFNVSGQYAYVHLGLTSTEGSSDVHLTFNYSDGTTQTSNSQTIPDWFDEITESKTLYYLINDLDRSQADGTGFNNANDPAIFGVRFSANAAKTLQSITVEKTASTGYLVFLGATGELNTAPTLTGTPATLSNGTEDTAYAITAVQLLQGFTDVDNDTLSVSGLTATNGTLTDNGDGTYTFNPAANYKGTVSLNYNVIDAKGGITPATGTFSLDRGNDAPTFKLSKIADNIFKISNSSSKSKLQVTLTGQSSNLVNELGVFTVDDAQGNINGIAPGAAGYAQAALDRAKVIFSAIANVPNGFNTDNLTHLLEFNSGDNFRFYLVKNSTTDAIRAGISPFTDILFSDPLTQKITDLGNDDFSLAWKDGSGNNAADFNNLVVKIQSTNDSLPLGTNLQGNSQGEVIDLRGVTSQVKADFVVNREAAFNNFISFYQVADENGGIDTNGDGKADILTGQAGYTEAAVWGRVAGIDLTVNNQGSATSTGTFQPGSIFVPFIITNGIPDALLDSNPNNDPAVYFPFLGANADKVDHIRLLGNNIFGFEDLASGGDKDFNDMIVRVNLTIA
ncbi:MAG: DUF4347 domain-containing protein [Nostoc sp.]|uniref:DUF4347 domain-containing protein n=1 Tax=Nostoc sp. TaxID=1180 RepID=UPI002FF87728